MIEGISIFKSNKQKSIAVWRKYLRGASEDVLEESYQATLGELEQVPLPSLQVIKSGLDILSLEYPQAKQTAPVPIIDRARHRTDWFHQRALQEVNRTALAWNRHAHGAFTI